MRKNSYKDGRIVSYSTVGGAVTVTLSEKSNITSEELKKFELDLKRGELAVKNKRRTPDEVGLWFLSKYHNNFEDLFEAALASTLIGITSRFEEREYINSSECSYSIDKYNNLIKNLQELKKLKEEIGI